MIEEKVVRTSFKQSTRHGFSLIEVLVALAILGIGSMLSLKLIGVFIQNNKGLASNQEAVAIATRLMAEISDAELRSPTDYDPGLQVTGQPVMNPVVGSSIVSVGEFVSGSYESLNGSAPPAGLVAAFQARYVVNQCPECQSPVPGNANLVGPGGIEILIEVDNAEQGGPLIAPIRMAVRRSYSHGVSCPPGSTSCNVRGYN